MNDNRQIHFHIHEPPKPPRRRLGFFGWFGLIIVALVIIWNWPVNARDKEVDKAIGLALRPLATEQLNRALADIGGRSPVEAAKRVSAEWDADKKTCEAGAKSREENYECGDMISYGSSEAMRWLDEHQKEGEVIYAAQLCNRDSFQYGNACSPVVVLTPRYQSENACKKFAMEAAETDIKLQFGNNDHHCKSRSGRNQPWIEVASYNFRVSK
jgi:hypothetical protein